MLSATGRIRAPVERVPYPRTNWKYCVIRKMKPNSAKNVTVTAPLAALNRRSRNRLRSSIGWAIRRSTDDEHQQEQGAEREAADRVRRGPAVRGRLDDRVDQRAEHRDREHESGQVERRYGGVARLGDQHVRRRGRHQGQRDQRPEHAPPGEVLEQQAADDRARGHPDADHGTPDAQRGRALAPLAEGVADDRQRGREDHRGGDMPMATRAAIRAPDESTRAPTMLAPAKATRPEDQRRAAAEAVGQAARRQHQGGEGEVVAVDDPLERPGAGLEVGGDARQRDVDDRGVEVDGEHGRADREQDGKASERM